MTPRAVWLLILIGTAAQAQRPAPVAVEVVQLEPTWLTLRWTGPPGPYEISYRHRSWPRDRRVTFSDLPGPSYTVVGLHHETAYDLVVRPMVEPLAPEPGKRARPVQAKLQVRTPPWTARRSGMLSLWPTARLSTFDQDQASPRIAAWRDALFVVESHAGALHLSRLSPADLKVEWTRELVSAQPGQTLLCRDVCATANWLYLLYLVNGAPHLLVYNAETGQVPEPALPLPAAVALAVYGREVRALTWETGLAARPLLSLKPVTGTSPDSPPVWLDTPPGAFAPALATFADQLLLLYSDRARLAERPEYEPLLGVQFDGAKFHWQRKLADLGRNFMAQGQQYGPSLYVVYSSDLPYLSYGGRYAALMLSTLAPGTPGLETLRYVDDNKYNVNADIAASGNALFVVYEKFEQAPEGDAATTSHGIFIGKIEIGPVARPR